MRPILSLVLILFLSACSALKTMPKPPPAPTQQAQEIDRAQSLNLPKLGTISAAQRGSPDDVQRTIAARANAAGATYYQIVSLSESIVPGQWYANAILYGPSTAGSTQK
ncbi:Biofilm peroxide resistance protein BsmA [Paramixta manurensis]|uniref:Biofilm peroxide resistance protein BsmA n=1 Tax=Paramixta manurensis TaxID=2740817 RepID=A0A6M8UPG1_9GAMM|nr:Biofilm peroxide resistance protein BsmA [Erwiniaceae bacterium PD-1]